MYVVGEAYDAENSLVITAWPLIHKMLQVERILCVLAAKEQKADVLTYVLGTVFVASTLTSDVCLELVTALTAVQDCLPLLWRLHCQGRFLAIHALPPTALVFAAELTATRAENAVALLRADMATRMEALERKMDIIMAHLLSTPAAATAAAAAAAASAAAATVVAPA